MKHIYSMFVDSKIQYYKDVSSPQMIHRLIQLQSKFKWDVFLSLISQFKNIMEISRVKKTQEDSSEELQ